MTTETDLVRRLLDNDEEAWTDVVDRYYEKLIIFCMRYVGNRPLAETLVQTTFTRAIENPASSSRLQAHGTRTPDHP